jgi:hypothetical protein
MVCQRRRNHERQRSRRKPSRTQKGRGSTAWTGQGLRLLTAVHKGLDAGEKNGENMARLMTRLRREIVQLWRD